MPDPIWNRPYRLSRLCSSDLVRTCVGVGVAYATGVDTKTRRWSLRVTPAEDTLVRRALEATGMSLNEYVVSCAVAGAAEHLADRRAFPVSPQVWEELQELLDRPPAAKPRIAALLAEPSILDRGEALSESGSGEPP